MRRSLILVALLGLLLLFAVHVDSYGNGTCPANRTVVTLGVFPAAAYIVYYGQFDPTAAEVYAESGALPGAQAGAAELLLGPTYGHSYTCVWPNEAEWDYLLY